MPKDLFAKCGCMHANRHPHKPVISLCPTMTLPRLEEEENLCQAWSRSHGARVNLSFTSDREDDMQNC